MDELKRKYQAYLDYMDEYEKEYDNYPASLSNDEWRPYSFDEYRARTKDGKNYLRTANTF